METLKHIGKKRRSGRYDWGSGERPYQHEDWNFLVKLDKLRNEEGLKDIEIARRMGITTTQLRARVTIANQNIKAEKRRLAIQMISEGQDIGEIANMLDASVNTIKKYISQVPKKTPLQNTVETIERGLEKTGYLDIGAGVERQIGVSKEKLKAARQLLEAKGYHVHEIYIPQINHKDRWTTIKVITKEADLEVVKKNKHLIKNLEEYSDDAGITFKTINPPKRINSDRIVVNYKEDGGIEKDGLIEIRRGAEGLDLGRSRYAQVRIATDHDTYLKGMAVYADDTKFPKGVDIIFNTNKSKEIPKDKVLKPLKLEDDNVFGSTISRQNGYLNIVREEGEWAEWKKTLSSQFLSKQPLALVKDRLDATYKDVRKQYDEIERLNNPVVKEKLLQDFAEGLDSKARDLKAKGLSRTMNHVILPFPELKPDEVYAPNYKDGEKIVLIRHPHGGRFEIVEAKVNNKGPGKSVIGNAIDAIGINPTQAEKLSGADFDGDSVLTIPNNSNRIKSKPMLEAMRGFDPHTTYARDYKTMNEKDKDFEMGKITNLISDMSLHNATDGELARAVKHSMVVIDAYKHQLDYRQSYEDNSIAALERKYQLHTDIVSGRKAWRGAATLISRARNQKTIKEHDEEYVLKDGTIKTRRVKEQKIAQMDLVDDARKLSSGTDVENAYADYANKLKALKGTAIKEMTLIPPFERNPSAAKKYAAEVESLRQKLAEAELNAPRERQVQLLANRTYHKYKKEGMSKDDRKKLKQRAQRAARRIYIPEGYKAQIDITPKEWEAIQSHAIYKQTLKDILRYANEDQLVKYATPRPVKKLATAKQQRAQMLLDKGYTFSEIAERLGVSPTTVQNLIQREYR